MVEGTQTIRCTKIFWIAIFTVVLLTGIILLIMFQTHNSRYEQSYIEQSKDGFYYKINEYEYVNESSDKPIAIAALQSLLREINTEYTVDQLNKLPNYFVIAVLEARDRGFKMGLLAMIPRFMHPNYEKASHLVQRCLVGDTGDLKVFRSNSNLVSVEMKNMVYDVIQAYPYLNTSADKLSSFTVLNSFRFSNIPPKNKLASDFLFISFDGADTLKKLKTVEPAAVQLK